MTDHELRRVGMLWSQGFNTQEIARFMSQGRETVPECVIYNLMEEAKAKFSAMPSAPALGLRPEPASAVSASGFDPYRESGGAA